MLQEDDSHDEINMLIVRSVSGNLGKYDDYCHLNFPHLLICLLIVDLERRSFPIIMNLWDNLVELTNDSSLILHPARRNRPLLGCLVNK